MKTMSERYYTFPEYCRRTFGKKLFRVPLNIGFTCPNRDGKLDTRGCIFCAGGSGDFADLYDGSPIDPNALPYVHKSEGCGYIGYFQAYTNTYGPMETMRHLFTCALEDPVFDGISIATRPDCLGEEVLQLLEELKKLWPQKFIWVELGLQSASESSAVWMRRGYAYPVFEEAVRNLKRLDIGVIVHVIIGLPGEGKTEVRETVSCLNQLGADGVKLQLLHILEGTDLAGLYRQGHVQVLDEEEYIELVLDAVAHLDPGIVIHRLTGDGSGDKLLAPQWSRAKRKVLNHLQHEMAVRNITQGCALERKREL